MKEMSKLFFLHIPKTGGTTFNHILYQNFSDSQQFKIEPRFKQNSFDRFNSLTEREKKKIRIIRGHFYYGIHNKIQVQNFQYFTIIRNPVKRIVSHYYYSRSLPKHYLYNDFNKQGFKPEDFFSGQISFEAVNGQTAQIAGFDPEMSKMGKAETLEYLRSPDLLEKAIANIENDFSFVGLTEKFDHTLYLLNERLNFKNRKLFYKRKNVSAQKQNGTLIAGEIELIKKNNQQDILLYKYVESKYQQKAEPSNINLLSYSKPSLALQLYLFQLKFINRYLR